MEGGGHTVLVLGAGASVAEAQRHRPSRDRDHPPLDADFFRKVAQHSAGRAEFKRVLARSRELGQPDLCSTTQPVSLEQYLGRLYFEMSTSPTASNVSAYYDLVRLYAAELVTTTNWMAHRKGNLTRVIARELALQRQVSIVTFNHDLLVENALDQLPRRLHQRFCLHHSYGLLADHSWCHEAADEEFDVIRCGGDSDISIYKMHGSVNWVYRTREKNPPANLTKTKRSLFIQINKTIRPWSTTLTAAEGRGRGVWYSWPLIVPPIYEKHGLIHGELRTVWDGAANALLSATRAIFFGYSFPRADLHARYFFQGMAQRNQALRRPILLNPDPGSHGSLWEVLRPEQVTHYRSVREFLAT